jgi:hypothetical protein
MASPLLPATALAPRLVDQGKRGGTIDVFAFAGKLLKMRRGRGEIGVGGGTGMKALARILAGFFLLVAVIFAVYDASRTEAGGSLSFVTVSETWSAVAPASLKSARESVERRIHPVVWTWGIDRILQLPAWASFGLLGLILAYAGRRRRQVNIYAN